MTRSVRLRPWQKRALDRLAETAGPDFLAVATPGAGKTTFALTAARIELAKRGLRRLIVVVPTQHLKSQWADAAARFDLALDTDWSASRGLPADVHGVVVTYQQVAANPAALRPLADRSFAVFDEIHHLGDDRAWGAAVLEGFGGAARRLSLSGTPFRSDTRAIPFVRYRLDEAEADFEYGYADALREGGVVRPVYFPRLNGEMEWTAPDGSMHRATFEDPLDRQLANQRLRTALSAEGEWLAAVLGQAHRELLAARQRQPDAGGLVIAMDQDHARAIAALMQTRLGTRVVVATSDDPEASQRIARFSRSDVPWIVAVRMVSEGVDIPRLRVGVFATNTTTELFFRQAVGRLVRWVPGAGRQFAYLFIPDDVRLRTYAHQLADARRHSLRKRSEDSDRADQEPDPTTLDAQGEPEQLSLFAALSATPVGSTELLTPPSTHDGQSGHDSYRGAGMDPLDGEEDGAEANRSHEDSGLLLTLAPLPVLLSAPVGGAAVTVGQQRDERRKLRELNAALVAELVARTGWPHSKVNAELNQRAGIRKVTEATSSQLQQRVDRGRRWLDELRRR